MKIVYAITYYAPHLSGLTLPVVALAEAMAARGHEVHVVCARHEGDLPREDVITNVHVHRVPVRAMFGKGPLVPGFGPTLWRVARRADLVHIIAPQFDAAPAALAARLRGVPVVMSYVCSLTARGPLGALVTAAIRVSHLLAGLLSRKIIVLSDDYASQSRFARGFAAKRAAIPVPVPSYPATALPYRAPGPPYRIGFVGRISPDKSLPVLIAALPHLRALLPGGFAVELVGPSDPARTPGQRALEAALGTAEAEGLLTRHGLLSDAELATFYRDIDVLVLPTNDRIEAYGLVQVEAMLRGTPCVASDRPGMRLPVRDTGFGRLFAPGGSEALAEALADVLKNGPPRIPDPAELHAANDPEKVFDRMEALYREVH